MHRFVFHYVPADKPWAMRLHFIFHGVHHDYPSDAKRLGITAISKHPTGNGLLFSLMPYYRLIIFGDFFQDLY
jgi:4-hydroxysphinganine ceramide fatty acyl 2-hydroxylase